MLGSSSVQPTAVRRTLPARYVAGLLVGVVIASVGATAWAQGASVAGSFSDGRITLTLRFVGGGQYVGDLTIDGATYQLSASGSPERVEGTFVSGGVAYPFGAALASADAVTLTSGANAFTLRRVAEQAAPAPAPVDSTQARAVGRGTRVSYDHAVASHPGTNAGPDARGTGARGVTRVEVLHLDDGLCVTQWSGFRQNATGSVMVLSPLEGRVLVSRDGTCDGVWWPPERLATYQSPPGGIEVSSRAPFQLPQGGATFDALVVQHEFQGSRSSNAFDLASGLLLMHTEGSGPLPAPAAVPTMNAVMTILDVRAVAYPWDLHAPFPPAVAQLVELRVEGSVSNAFVGAGYLPPHVERFDMVLDVVERRPNLLLLRPRGNAAGDAYLAISPSLAMYLPPSAAAALRPGQRIDEDPLTGTVLSVERVDANGIVLALDGPGLRGRTTYDAATGLLVSEVVEVNDGVSHDVYELRVTGVR